jgi:rhamnose transport system ATP-binding protein
MSTPVDGGGPAQSGALTIELQGIGKRFGGQVALRDASLKIRPGTVHALVGENGAGKSTLGRIVAGLIQPSEGSMFVRGREVSYRKPASALRDGISMIAQEIALAPDLTVAENVMLGFEERRNLFLSRRATYRRCEELVDETGFELELGRKVSELSLAKQQEVEILRALARQSRVIVMDEPTAALGAADSEALHLYIKKLRATGISVVYVSHFLEDVLEVADEITVLRNGQLVKTMPNVDITVDSLIKLMLGKTVENVFPRSALEDRVREKSALRLHDLVAGATAPPVSLDLKQGEIVGLFGLMGAGRSRLAHCIFGGRPRLGGRMELDGKEFSPSRPRQAIEAGLVLLPESRRDQGLFLPLSQLENAASSSLHHYSVGGFVSRGRLKKAVTETLQDVQLDRVSLGREVHALSGGNQQKVLFAKCILTGPSVLILDEPTRGVDIGAKQSIYRLITQLAEKGAGILLISSDLEEIAQISDRVLVMRGGEVAGEFAAEEVDSDGVLAAAFGQTKQEFQS